MADSLAERNLWLTGDSALDVPFATNLDESRRGDAADHGPRLSVAITSPGWPADAFANGVIPYVARISQALREQGHRVTVLATSVVGDFDRSTVRPIQPSTNPLGRTIDRFVNRFRGEEGWQGPSSRALVKNCRRLIVESGLQLLEMEEVHGLSRWVQRKLSIPVVVRLHGPWFLNGPNQGAIRDEAFRRRVQLEKEAIVEADAVTAPSRDVLERTRDYYGIELKNAKVIPNPSAFVPAEDHWKIEFSEPETILFVGRFDLHKGGDLMIKAFAEIARKRPGVHLCFVGPDRGLVDSDGEKFGLEEYIQRHASDVSNRIERSGQVPNSRLALLRRKARVTVVCSRYETFGITLTEAMTAGCPTVATRAGAFVEIVEDGRNGLLCSPEDPLDLAEKIVALLDDEDLASRLGQQAGLDGALRYEAGTIARELSEYYARLIRDHATFGRGGSPRCPSLHQQR